MRADDCLNKRGNLGYQRQGISRIFWVGDEVAEILDKNEHQAYKMNQEFTFIDA